MEGCVVYADNVDVSHIFHVNKHSLSRDPLVCINIKVFNFKSINIKVFGDYVEW